jgi:hypothetical protein
MRNGAIFIAAAAVAGLVGWVLLKGRKEQAARETLINDFTARTDYLNQPEYMPTISRDYFRSSGSPDQVMGASGYV